MRGETTVYLDGLSALAARSFPTTRAAIDAALRLLVDQLGMRSSFLTRIAREERRHEVLAAHNEPGGCDVAVGDVLELPQTF